MNLDKTLNCRDCGNDFVFTASEQDFYAEKGLVNNPSRCPECRAARKQNNARNDNYQQREMHDATCAACGIQTQVPFRPSNDRPVYCRDCFRQNNSRRY